MNAALAYQRARQQAAVILIGGAADPELVALCVFHPADPEVEWPPEVTPAVPGALLPDTDECRKAQVAGMNVGWDAIDALAKTLIDEANEG